MFISVFTLGTIEGFFSTYCLIKKYQGSWKCSLVTCTETGLLSPTGVITALAVAVGLLVVALLFSIGVAIHRRRAHYSREV